MGGIKRRRWDLWGAREVEQLAHCIDTPATLGANLGQRHLYRKEPSGGIGAFTPDSFPVFDTFCQNAYVTADSNHGYKMIAVGREIARVLRGEHSTLLHPFRFDRFASGDLHPVSHSPYPWS